MSTSNPLDGLTEHERRWYGLIRNVAWLVAPICAVVILVVGLRGLSPWAKYLLATVLMIPLTVVLAVIVQLLGAVGYRAMSGRAHSD